MAPLHASAATPSQKLASAARRERERKIAAHARPDTPIACPSASARPLQANGLQRSPIPPSASPSIERRKQDPALVRIWFRIIEEIIPSFPAEPTIEDIQRAVERHCKVRHIEMISACRTAEVARSRQIAMFLVKNLTSSSLAVIGSQFGGRDRATVLHAVRRIETLRARDKRLAADLDAIQRTLATIQEA